ncbi:hypothetical protein [Dyadobacter sp. NIV53]|uniref:hypothetical protein n=1 Tax=Dyadobacter sp. NIV53 TaxID=2861765 RepID=UPI001C86A625|nr:hypothetical protein [Dyadobacter sp. NIV53]
MENREIIGLESNIILDLTVDTNANENFEIPPGRREMGGDIPDIEVDNIRLFIGKQPVSLNLKKLNLILGKQVPPEIQLFKRYNVYVLTHKVGVMKVGGFKSVSEVGYKVRFSEEQPVNILNLMPQPKFVKNIGGDFSFDAALSINGARNPTPVYRIFAK